MLLSTGASSSAAAGRSETATAAFRPVLLSALLFASAGALSAAAFDRLVFPVEPHHGDSMGSLAPQTVCTEPGAAGVEARIAPSGLDEEAVLPAPSY